MSRFAPSVALVVAIMFSTSNLNAASRKDDSAVIAVPASTAQKWVLPDGLTLIVQEDRSAPVASVQAWCATGSIDEDERLGAGLSHILEHMLFKGTKTRPKNAIAQKVQDVGGYINAYTSFDRTVFWIDVPKDGVGTALDILADAMMNSTLPAERVRQGTGSDPARICHGVRRSGPDGRPTHVRHRLSKTSVSSAGHRGVGSL